MSTRTTAPVWLLGAGASIGAGMDSTGALTRQVLHEESIARDSQERYRLREGSEAEQGDSAVWVYAIRTLLREADLLTRWYYASPERPPNYEDLSYLVGQLADSEQREYDNPAVMPLIWRLQGTIGPMLSRLKLSGGRSIALADLARQAASFIIDIASARLARPPTDLTSLAAVVDGAQAGGRQGPVWIATLNHDRVLESALAERGIPLLNGFGLPDRDLQFWDPTAFERPGPGAVLLKLHGSVNWCRVRPQLPTEADEADGDPESERLAIVGPVVDPRDTSDRVWERMDGGRPRLLVGTFN